MKKEELKNIILEEAIYIKNLIEEKKKIENFLKEKNQLKKSNEKNEEEIEETTGKGLGVNRRASHLGKIGNKLKKEEKISENKKLRNFIKNFLYETYKIK